MTPLTILPRLIVWIFGHLIAMQNMREIWKKIIFCIGLKRDRVFLRFSVSHRVQITERVDSHIDDMQFCLVLSVFFTLVFHMQHA